jgi:hypothetical protein
MVFNMEAKSIEDVPVVREYPDVFPEEKFPGVEKKIDHSPSADPARHSTGFFRILRRIEDHVWFEDWWMVASLCDE